MSNLPIEPLEDQIGQDLLGSVKSTKTPSDDNNSLLSTPPPPAYINACLLRLEEDKDKEVNSKLDNFGHGVASWWHAVEFAKVNAQERRGTSSA